MFRIIRGRMYYLIAMNCICVEDSFNFIGCNVIIFLHRCSHTENAVSHIIAFERCQIDIQWLFIGRFGVFDLIICGTVLHSEKIELFVVIQYLFHLYKCQVQPFFYFIQYSPDFGGTVFHELPQLLTILFLPLLLLFFFKGLLFRK